MTDDKIKEIYIFAEFAKRAGQERIPVHIFPFEMTEKNMQRFLQEVKNYDMRGYDSFWENLKVGYDYFEVNQKIPNIKVGSNGEYIW